MSSPPWTESGAIAKSRVGFYGRHFGKGSSNILCPSPAVPTRQSSRNDFAIALPDLLVFIDETGAKTNLTPTRGRVLKGQRVPGSAPAGRYQNTTLISAIGLDRLSFAE